MKYKNVRIGDHIEQVDSRNLDNKFTVNDLRGVDKNKKFIISAATTNGLDLSNYKIIQPMQFVYSGMQTGRDKCVRVSLNIETAIIVSPAYTVFKVIDDNLLIPEYLMLFFLNPEIDRIGWYKSDSSVRANLDWDRFCEIEIPLPPIEKQKEYIKIYSNLLKLSVNHENSFFDLQLISNTFIENLVKKYGTEQLGTHTTPTDERNRELGSSDLKGISIKKKFIESKANMNGVSLDNYKVVRPNEFAYVTVTSRNGEKLSIALNDDDKSYVISSTYQTFKIADQSKLLPEFLLLWFKRPEFDRYARYNSWGSARETFDWSEMQRVRLPIPPIAVQKSIVSIHHALQSRKKLTQKLNAIIKEISPVLIKNAKNICMEKTT